MIKRYILYVILLSVIQLNVEAPLKIKSVLLVNKMLADEITSGLSYECVPIVIYNRNN